MGRAGKAVAWICIFSTLLMGCYTSEMIEPTGDEKERIPTEDIRFVLMKDGTEYEPYDSVIVNDTLVAEVWCYESFLPTLEQVKLPMSDVAKVSVPRYDPLLTVLGCVGAVVLLGAIIAIPLAYHSFGKWTP
jgi:hypothetical protein